MGRLSPCHAPTPTLFKHPEVRSQSRAHAVSVFLSRTVARSWASAADGFAAQNGVSPEGSGFGGLVLNSRGFMRLLPEGPRS